MSYMAYFNIPQLSLPVPESEVGESLVSSASPDPAG